jgi:hypothetical protein
MVFDFSKPKQVDEMEVFLKALEKAEPGEREAYLDKVCGHDVVLRSSVELLIRHHFRKGGALDTPVVLPGESDTSRDPTPEEDFPSS